MHFAKVSYSLSLSIRWPRFFEFTSRSIALSSICSASSKAVALHSHLPDTSIAARQMVSFRRTLIYIFVKCRLAYAVSSTNISRPFPSFVFLQHCYDLFVAKSLLHLSVRWLGILYNKMEEY